MASISPDLYKRLRSLLLRCGPFDNRSDLRAFFVDARIALWRDNIPEASTSSDRVNSLVNFLLQQRNTHNENGLVLFMSVLSDQKDINDFCYQQILSLTQELKSDIERQNDVSETGSHIGELKSWTNALISPIERWAKNWECITFRPRAFLVGSRWKATSLEFFVETYVFTYLSILITFLSYFAVFYRNRMINSSGETGLDALSSFIVFFPFFCLGLVLIYFVGGVLSYIPFRFFGSKAPFIKHVRLLFYLTNLEPILAIASALSMLVSSDIEATVEFRSLTNYIALSFFLITRLYYLILAFRVIDIVHPISKTRYTAAYIIGFPITIFAIIGRLQYVLLNILYIFSVAAFD